MKFSKKLISAVNYDCSNNEVTDKNIYQINHPEFYDEQFEIKAPPMFPTISDTAYYGLTGQFVELATRNSEADKVAVLMSFLCAMAAINGSDKFLMVGESKFPARLYSVLVGNTARARKGTSLQPVRRILKKIEDEIKKNLPHYEFLPIADGGLSSGEGLIYAIRDESIEIDDDTGLPIDPGVEDKRLFLIEEEFANVLKMSQRPGNVLSAILRRAWDALCALSPMTKNNRLSSTNPHINLLAHITRQELTLLLGEADRYNGYANRFLWCCVRRTKRLPEPKKMDDSELTEISKKIANNFCNIADKNEIILSAETNELWHKLYYEVSVDLPGIIGSMTSRAETQILRIAMIYCLIDGTTNISSNHLEAAFAVWNFSKESTVYLFSFHNPEDRDPETTLFIDALSEKDLSQSDVSNLFCGHKTSRELNVFLSELESMNLIRQTKLKTSGRSKTMWSLVKDEKKANLRKKPQDKP